MTQLETEALEVLHLMEDMVEYHCDEHQLSGRTNTFVMNHFGGTSGKKDKQRKTKTGWTSRCVTNK